MKLLLAPMAALSHEALRRTIARFGGCDEYYTEMIHAASFINGGPYEHCYASCAPEPEKTVWQLTGAHEKEIVRCARLLTETEGASSVIGIDINMGCPAPEIYRQGAGVAWMSKPFEQVESMLRGVRAACASKRLSVKIRLGEEDFTTQGLFDFADMLCSCGVERITLHPRTRKERYARPVRVQYVRLLGEFIKSRYPAVSVAGNGAIDGPESLAAFAAHCPLSDSFMIGRAAVQKPWIFSVLKRSAKPDGRDTEKAGRDTKPDGYDTKAGGYGTGAGVPGSKLQIDLVKLAEDFIADLEAYQPADFWKTRAQRFFAYYCDNVSFAHYIKSQVLNQRDHRAMLDRFTRYFDEMPQERVVSV